MTPAFISAKEKFLPSVPFRMLKEDMRSEAAIAIVTEALLMFHSGVAVIKVDGLPNFWEVYTPTSCALSTHCGISAPCLWGFRTGPTGFPEFGRYDFDADNGYLKKAAISPETHPDVRAIEFANNFYKATERAHKEQQALVALRDFCSGNIEVPDRWSINNSTVRIKHPRFTLDMDSRPVIPFVLNALDINGGASGVDIADLFLYFYDIHPVGENGPGTLDEAINLFVPSDFSLDI